MLYLPPIIRSLFPLPQGVQRQWDEYPYLPPLALSHWVSISAPGQIGSRLCAYHYSAASVLKDTDRHSQQRESPLSQFECETTLEKALKLQIHIHIAIVTSPGLV